MVKNAKDMFDWFCQNQGSDKKAFYFFIEEDTTEAGDKMRSSTLSAVKCEATQEEIDLIW